VTHAHDDLLYQHRDLKGPSDHRQLDANDVSMKFHIRVQLAGPNA